MKKTIIISAALILVACGVQAKDYAATLSIDSNGVAIFTNTLSGLTPKLVYSEISGTETGTVTMSYCLGSDTNSSTWFRLGAFSDVGGSESVHVLGSPLVSVDAVSLLLATNVTATSASKVWVSGVTMSDLIYLGATTNLSTQSVCTAVSLATNTVVSAVAANQTTLNVNQDVADSNISVKLASSKVYSGAGATGDKLKFVVSGTDSTNMTLRVVFDQE